MSVEETKPRLATASELSMIQWQVDNHPNGAGKWPEAAGILLADRAAYRALVAEQLAGLLASAAVLAAMPPYEQALMLLKNNEVRRAATALGITLP